MDVVQADSLGVIFITHFKVLPEVNIRDIDLQVGNWSNNKSNNRLVDFISSTSGIS